MLWIRIQILPFGWKEAVHPDNLDIPALDVLNIILFPCMIRKVDISIHHQIWKDIIFSVYATFQFMEIYFSVLGELFSVHGENIKVSHSFLCISFRIVFVKFKIWNITMKPIIVILERQLHRNKLHSLIRKVFAALSSQDIFPRMEKNDFSNFVKIIISFSW